MLPLRTNTSCPARSSTVAIGGAPGPVTTTSLTLVRVGSEKAHERLQLGRDGHHRGDHVHFAAYEGGVQLIARDWHDHDVDLEVAGLQVRVQIVLEQLQRLVGNPPLLPLVDEVVRAVEGHGHANHATLTISSKSPVNGLSITRRTASGSAS